MKTPITEANADGRTTGLAVSPCSAARDAAAKLDGLLIAQINDRLGDGRWSLAELRGRLTRIAYFHTHWVAHFRGWVLCTACEPAKWIRADDWRHFHLECEPRSPFHITHHYVLANK